MISWPYEKFLDFLNYRVVFIKRKKKSATLSAVK